MTAPSPRPNRRKRWIIALMILAGVFAGMVQLESAVQHHRRVAWLTATESQGAWARMLPADDVPPTIFHKLLKGIYAGEHVVVRLERREQLARMMRVPPECPSGTRIIAEFPLDRGLERELRLQFGRASIVSIPREGPSSRLSAGENAPDIEFTDVATKQVSHLADYRGKIVALEFWATWCGPCQRSMRHLDDAMRKRGASWGSRIQILPVSIDRQMDVIGPHAQAAGWNNLRFRWAGGEQHGFDSPAAVACGLRSIPASVIIDEQGVVVWSGHPDPLYGEPSLTDRLEAILKERAGTSE